MSRWMKKIIIVYPEEAKTKFAGIPFKSYKAVARELLNSERVTVSVQEYQSGEKPPEDWSEGLLGYGSVEKIDENSWYQPRRLAPDY